MIASPEEGRMENKVMLISYPDSLGSNLRELGELLEGPLSGAVHGLHILPFFPSSGDRGFAPLRYDEIDSTFGSWEDFERIAERHPVMVDYMINHISAQSRYYKDFLAKKDDSEYADLFIRYKDFWPEGEPSERQVEKIYKRKPRAPYVDAHFADGSTEKLWCTFGEEQIDLNLDSSVGRRFMEENLRGLARHGAAAIRLDAFAYAIKKADTSCFFVEPEIWQLLESCASILKGEGAEILPEIHEHYSMPLRIAQKGYRVYDFALPMLVLHALYFGDERYLAQWLRACPRRQYTTLDTHDGIGVVDVKGLLPDEEIERTKEHLFDYGANVKRVYNTAAYNNLDIYQINCSYYSALGDDDEAYLLARALQFFAPGIPQVYYVGMLAGKNDLELLERTKEGRNINRHYYSRSEVEREVERPVVKRLLELMRFRNECGAFDGDFSCETMAPGRLRLTWTSERESASLDADLKDRSFEVSHGVSGAAQ
jgi:sucrose phosphorylase